MSLLAQNPNCRRPGPGRLTRSGRWYRRGLLARFANIGWTLLLGALVMPAARPAACAQPLAMHTPPPGSAERVAILDAIRAEIRQLHDLEVVFVVDRLNVLGEWAWAETRPQSRDGVNHYEDVAALLRFEEDSWRLLELIAPDEEGIANVRSRHPEAPPEIFSAL